MVLLPTVELLAFVDRFQLNSTLQLPGKHNTLLSESGEMALH